MIAARRSYVQDYVDTVGKPVINELNLFIYTNDNPVNYVDPEGLQSKNTLFPGSSNYKGTDDLPLEDPWLDPTLLVPGGGSVGKCMLKVEVKIMTGSNIFKITSKALKMGYRIDRAHHGKRLGHSKFWRW